MPYNSYYPIGYQPFGGQYNYQPQQPMASMQPQQQAQPTPQPMTSSIIWVQGEAGAKSYFVAPNTTVQLWDSERQTIYIKSADASGMPSIKTLDYTIRDAAPQTAPVPSPAPSETYATKSEVNVLAEQIVALRDKIEGITTRSMAKAKKEVNEDG